ncbi:MAG: S41 family peptidase [Oscillospiraceae bacterium]|nr:S41 family peptidase [Oscillospiraceae bacterium]
MKKLTALVLVVLLCAALAAPAVASIWQELADDYTYKAYEISDYIADYSLEYKEKDTYPLFDALEEILKDDPELFMRLVDAMFSKLDIYSMYLPKEKYDDAFPRGATYVGIGVTVNMNCPFGIITGQVYRGSPAAEAGMKTGDVIMSVDGTDVSLMPVDDIIDLVRGDPGTEVTLGILRQNTGRLEFKVERRAISSPNVTYGYIEDGVGVISISRFGGFMDYVDFVIAYDEFMNNGVSSVIIDLRDNPGGSAEVLHYIMDYMVEEKDVTLFELVNSGETESYVSSGAAEWMPDKIVVLVNEYSSSAAEVLAGSLKALGLAEVVGQTTAGKARSQFHFGLIDDSVAIITAYEVFLADGKSYEEIGIVPDFEIISEGIPYAADMLGALDTSKTINKGVRSDNVLAMQKRLAALGIFPAEPDGFFGEMTLWSLNVFQKAMELKVTSNAPPATLKALDDKMKELLYFGGDAQMEFAVERAKTVE